MGWVTLPSLQTWEVLSTPSLLLGKGRSEPRARIFLHFPALQGPQHLRSSHVRQHRRFPSRQVPTLGVGAPCSAQEAVGAIITHRSPSGTPVAGHPGPGSARGAGSRALRVAIEHALQLRFRVRERVPVHPGSAERLALPLLVHQDCKCQL